MFNLTTAATAQCRNARSANSLVPRLACVALCFNEHVDQRSGFALKRILPIYGTASKVNFALAGAEKAKQALKLQYHVNRSSELILLG